MRRSIEGGSYGFSSMAGSRQELGQKAPQGAGWQRAQARDVANATAMSTREKPYGFAMRRTPTSPPDRQSKWRPRSPDRWRSAERRAMGAPRPPRDVRTLEDQTRISIFMV